MFKISKNLLITITLLLICSIISSVLIYIANQQVLDNAQVMGESIAQNLVSVEKTYMTKYDSLLATGTMAIKEMKENNFNSTNINQYMKDIFEKFEQTLSINQIQLCFVVDGEFYSAGNIYNEKIDYQSSEWYTKALEANGNVIYTDSYLYGNTNERVVTTAMKMDDSNDVIAINIFIDKINNWPDIEDLPEGTRYYICDSQGNILHKEIDGFNVKEEILQEYIQKLLIEINEGKHQYSNSFVREISNEKRGVYYTQASNGWNYIVTIPYDYLLNGVNKISFAYFGALLLFVGLTIYLIFSERKAYKKNMLYNRITDALGESYYALYLIDFEKETYSMLKASEYVCESIPQTGEYNVFMDCIKTIIEKEAYKDFKETFSIENIRKLVNNNVKSFGGDFKRIFNGEARWVNVKMLYNAKNNNVHEVVLAFEDIHDEKERELEKMQIIRESVEATEQAVKSKNKFFANMSHDMRTPLNAIINLSNLSKEKIDDKEKLVDYLTKINISSKQLLELINDILEVSKMEEGINTINKSSFDIDKALKDTLSVFEEQAKIQNKNMKIVYNIKNNYVISDWGKIRQIVNNIVSNALKYTLPNGNIQIQINELEGKFISKYELIVGDDGIGMSKEFLEKLYTPFARETRFYSEEITGTGLGMVIVNNNVQKLNGQIEVKSEPGKGTMFKVTLPLEITMESSENIDVKSEENELIDLKGRKILIAEDNELNMEISTEVLEMQGVIVSKATNGKEAYEIFKSSKENTFDAILMDMQMPIMDGCEATKEIRKLPRKDAKIIPILAVTANTFAEDVVNTQKAGMNDHISKPIDFAVLQKTLSQYLTKK